MTEEKKYLRFPLPYRIEHWIFMLAFTTLGVTGLVQKYASTGISLSIIRFLGGIETTRTIHHTAAIILMLEVIYHLGVVSYRLFVRHDRPTMMPGWQDVKAAFQAFVFNIGFSKNPPQQGRYTFEEKLEYWAVVWGMVIMVITGFMMWNPIATTRFLPGEFIPAAKTAHGGEALLAVLAIILWHMYQVIVRHFNKSMFVGTMTEEEMLHDHPLELADIKAGLDKIPVSPKVLAHRNRIFFPVYGAFAILMLFAVYEFINMESTAIANRPAPENVQIYAPLTPTPLPTPLPTVTPPPQSVAPSTWEGGIAEIFQQKCAMCHGVQNPTASLNLTSYASILTGGVSGPGIVPGDLSSSQIYSKQTAGGHPGQLTPAELAIIKQWILLGAPEK